jgi:hypothetical protein
MKIRSSFNLGEEDVRKYVDRRGLKSAEKADAKPYTKAWVSPVFHSRFVFPVRANPPPLPSSLKSSHAPPALPPCPLPQAQKARTPDGAKKQNPQGVACAMLLGCLLLIAYSLPYSYYH